MNRIQLFGFLKHRLTAKTRHGVHSPFVYKLVEDCIYGQTPASISKVLAFFEKLKASEDVLHGVDFGKSEAKTQEYSVGQLARKSSIADFQAELLARLAIHHGPKRILELGTNLGKTSAVLAASLPEAEILSLEGNAALANQARQNLGMLALEGVRVEESTFDRFLEESNETFDFIFLDGDHHYDPTLRYFSTLKNKLRGEGPIILHDIYWSEGMHHAWKEICAMEDVTVSVDLYSMGLVYFRPKQEKEEFSIRFPRSVFDLL